MSDTRNLLARVDFSEESVEDENGSALRSVLERRALRMAAGKQNVQQATQETLGVSAGFEDLYLQLENNRIENSELKHRLHEEIAVPLRQLAKEGMPELESRLQWLQDHSSDRAAAREAHQECLAEADEVIVAMRAILERMRALESYNEVLALLREIIADQTELTEQTRERQQQLLRGLLGTE